MSETKFHGGKISMINDIKIELNENNGSQALETASAETKTIKVKNTGDMKDTTITFFMN
ncbi:MAG: hypothetical protein RR847_01855 [Bacilli bacterium]